MPTSIAQPIVNDTPAIASGRRGPRRPTMRPDSGAHSTIMAAIGSVARPASSGDSPRPCCRYSVLRKRNPANAANAATAAATDAENGIDRKKRRSINGSSRRGSQ